MSKNSAAHQKKVEHAVLKLLKHPGLSTSNAMVLAKFLKKDVANETVHRAVHRAVRQRRDRDRALLGVLAPPTDSILITDDPSLSDMTPLTLTTAAPSAPQSPKPKCKQIRPTASAIQQRRVDDLKVKRHKGEDVASAAGED
jgi:hypothetical protein